MGVDEQAEASLAIIAGSCQECVEGALHLGNGDKAGLGVPLRHRPDGGPQLFGEHLVGQAKCRPQRTRALPGPHVNDCHCLLPPRDDGCLGAVRVHRECIATSWFGRFDRTSLNRHNRPTCRCGDHIETGEMR